MIHDPKAMLNEDYIRQHYGACSLGDESSWKLVHTLDVHSLIVCPSSGMARINLENDEDYFSNSMLRGYHLPSTAMETLEEQKHPILVSHPWLCYFFNDILLADYTAAHAITVRDY